MMKDWEICRDENKMNEISQTHLDFELAAVLKFIGYGILTLFIWVLKKFGERHLASMDELAKELKEMRKELNALSSRVTAVEIRANMLHPDEP